jgi:hypothetical protein
MGGTCHRRLIACLVGAKRSLTNVLSCEQGVVVYKIPGEYADSGLFAYAGKSHPELARPDEIIVTFVLNTWGSVEPLFEQGAKDVYVPRFLRMTISPTSSS